MLHANMTSTTTYYIQFLPRLLNRTTTSTTTYYIQLILQHIEYNYNLNFNTLHPPPPPSHSVCLPSSSNSAVRRQSPGGGPRGPRRLGIWSCPGTAAPSAPSLKSPTWGGSQTHPYPWFPTWSPSTDRHWTPSETPPDSGRPSLPPVAETLTHALITSPLEGGHGVPLGGPHRALNKAPVYRSAARVLTRTQPWQHPLPSLIYLHRLPVRSCSTSSSSSSSSSSSPPSPSRLLSSQSSSAPIPPPGI